MREPRFPFHWSGAPRRRHANPIPAALMLLAVALLACAEREIAGGPNGSLQHWLGLHAWLTSLHLP